MLQLYPVLRQSIIHLVIDVIDLLEELIRLNFKLKNHGALLQELGHEFLGSESAGIMARSGAGCYGKLRILVDSSIECIAEHF